ncbi:biotin--[acetyl-CoA-carboxylase] ligase [Stakelama tenebrarum]|uniref:biotin--[biotin carboxyl-carrier protein] ligase n=1 Tax=Stakelama tenebrarum TaxID=2711215 RepID=A0A6G6Y712_9SPHN|nr:biotin--[acetyl-CoA-carboxylase] ligase [Sphingosinithalassobacter tenebrarum]QIG80498.1 biotin--[acetyl-CoA-carboxylase] ligase [Sphingosinithalassobacter tenebrarum]
MIRTVAETGSTNADMLALARSGAEEGLWLRAARQSGGRGRQGRAWVSPQGNLYASTLVRLRPADPPPATLALVTAVALEEAVRAFLPDAPLLLKWPNDLLVEGAKLSGILLERADNAVVIGVGVNIAHHPTDTERPATSMAAYGATPDPALFLETLAECFSRWLARWRGEGIVAIRDRWTARAHPEGTALQARQADGSVVEGLYAGLTGDGALILRLADGGRHVMHAGDVFLI